MERLQSAFGIFAILCIAFAMCPGKMRSKVQWKTILNGMLVLFGAALLVLKTSQGEWVFTKANNGVDRLLGHCAVGAQFVFGSLIDDKGSWGFLFFVKVLPTIIVFAALMSLLYYARVMPWIVKVMGKSLSKFLGTSGAESFSTVADIFVGQTEAPLVIGPYVPTLTKSELNACMVAGFATTAGGVLAAYCAMLKGLVPNVAGHLIACSVMCAPASLVIAKLILPETEQSQTAGNTQIEIPRASENIFDAIAAGTSDGLRLALNVGAMLIAFIALRSMLDGLIGWMTQDAWNLERIFGYLFSPIAWLMGISKDEMFKVGTLLGQKTVLTEFIAYQNLGQKLQADPQWLTERSRLIASYSLCGFANFASIGIQIGGYTGLAPNRRADISRLALKAMIGGALTTCLVAAVAGLLL